MILIVWFALFAIFAGSYLAYFGYLKNHASKPWGLKLDANFRPPVTLLIPAHNEETIIKKKLDNVVRVSYPKEKLEVIVIDDGSTDQTRAEANDFTRNHQELHFRLLSQYPRKGKAWALNAGLKASSNDIVIVSDADAFWSSTILDKALPYLSDPTVGAITGYQIAGNTAQSWVTKAEQAYLDFMLTWRLGESKIHSTIRFEGVFCAFKKNAFTEFDCESGADDSGTALRVVQNRFRTILVPEASVPSDVSAVFESRMKAKIRRATQLTGLWLQCLSLLLKRRLILPKRIAVPEIFLSVFSPFVFVALTVLTFVMIIFHPILFIPFVLILGVAAVIPLTRRYLVQGATDQLILFYSTILHVRRRKFLMWED